MYKTKNSLEVHLQALWINLIWWDWFGFLDRIKGNAFNLF